MNWVPFYYTIHTFWLVKHPVTLGLPLALTMLAVGWSCIYINYDADRQRVFFRKTKGKAPIWGSLPGTARWVELFAWAQCSLPCVLGGGRQDCGDVHHDRWHPQDQPAPHQRLVGPVPPLPLHARVGCGFVLGLACSVPGRHAVRYFIRRRAWGFGVCSPACLMPDTFTSCSCSHCLSTGRRAMTSAAR